MRALERHGEAELIDVYHADTETRDSLDLQATVLPSSIARAQKTGGFVDFKRRFEHYTCGISDRLRDIHGLVFAGGSVAGAICDVGFGDIDIFLCGKLEDARERLNTIYTMIAATQREKAGTTDTTDTKGKLVVTRSKHAITIFQVSSDTSGPAPIQIVLSIYPSVKEFLAGFGVDSC